MPKYARKSSKKSSRGKSYKSNCNDLDAFSTFSSNTDVRCSSETIGCDPTVYTNGNVIKVSNECELKNSLEHLPPGETTIKLCPGTYNIGCLDIAYTTKREKLTLIGDTNCHGFAGVTFMQCGKYDLDDLRILPNLSTKFGRGAQTQLRLLAPRQPNPFLFIADNQKSRKDNGDSYADHWRIVVNNNQVNDITYDTNLQPDFSELTRDTDIIFQYYSYTNGSSHGKLTVNHVPEVFQTTLRVTRGFHNVLVLDKNTCIPPNLAYQYDPANLSPNPANQNNQNLNQFGNQNNNQQVFPNDALNTFLLAGTSITFVPNTTISINGPSQIYGIDNLVISGIHFTARQSPEYKNGEALSGPLAVASQNQCQNNALIQAAQNAQEAYQASCNSGVLDSVFARKDIYKDVLYSGYTLELGDIHLSISNCVFNKNIVLILKALNIYNTQPNTFNGRTKFARGTLSRLSSCAVLAFGYIMLFSCTAVLESFMYSGGRDGLFASSSHGSAAYSRFFCILPETTNGSVAAIAALRADNKFRRFFRGIAMEFMHASVFKLGNVLVANSFAAIIAYQNCTLTTTDKQNNDDQAYNDPTEPWNFQLNRFHHRNPRPGDEFGPGDGIVPLDQLEEDAIRFQDEDNSLDDPSQDLPLLSACVLKYNVWYNCWIRTHNLLDPYYVVLMLYSYLYNINGDELAQQGVITDATSHSFNSYDFTSALL